MHYPVYLCEKTKSSDTPCHALLKQEIDRDNIRFHTTGQTKLICCFSDLFSGPTPRGSRSIKIKITGKTSIKLHENVNFFDLDCLYLFCIHILLICVRCLL